MNTYAIEVDKMDYDTIDDWSNYHRWNYENYEKPEDTGEEKYYYHVHPRDSEIYLWKESNIREHEDDEPEDDAAEKDNQKRREQFDKLYEKASELRREFIKRYKTKKTDINLIIEQIMRMLTWSSFYIPNSELISMLNLKLDINPHELKYPDIKKSVDKNPLKCLLISIFISIDGKYTYTSYYGQYTECERLDGLYKFICELGYEMSDVEKQLQDGTHPLYLVEEDEDEEAGDGT